MAKRDYQALARGVGVAIVVLAVLGIAMSLIRIGEALAADEPEALIARQVWILLGLVLVGAFGWWARTGHPRARNYWLAVLGPVVVGVLTPFGLVAVMLNVCAAVLSRKAAPRSSATANVG